MRRATCLLVALGVFTAAGAPDGIAAPAARPATAPARGLPDVLGVTHVAGSYHLTEGDFLNEGAEKVLALGSRVIKLYLHKPRRSYPFSGTWPAVRTPTELAATAPYRAVFRKPFTTYVLTVYSMGRPEHYWTKGISPEQKAEETRQFHELTRHLLTTYRGTGKTFVLQHWEGDWAIRGSFDRKADPTPVAIRGMIDWLGARQAGVDKARAEAPRRGVRVFHAAEVNRVAATMRQKRPGVVDRVLPHTRLDLVSYSAWDSQGDGVTFRKALDFIAAHMPDREPFGARNVYVGEFGAPENDFAPAKVRATVRNVVRTARDWGCPYVIYWQLYCNEPRRRPVRKNDDCRGFWLIRPDGTRAWTWGYLRGLLAGRQGA